MTIGKTIGFVAAASLFAGLAISIVSAEQVSNSVKAVHLSGLVGVNADSQAAVGKTVSMESMATPYGGGRFLALFRTKIDTLSIQYRDADGGLHGGIFTMPPGTAETIKKELVAQGAHTSALYENLIRQLHKQGFSQVYREGDRNAASVNDLVVLHSTVRGFKPGSERVRRATTVAGATSITVHCQFTRPDGNSLLEQDVKGKVRFFGGNLKSTSDFPKKAAHVAHEDFSSAKSE